MALIQRMNGTDEKGQPFPIRCVRNPAYVEQFRDDPEAVETLEVDDETNMALLLDIEANQKLYALNAGVVTKSGQPIAVSADGGLAKALKLLNAIEAKADAGTFTDNTQRDRAIGALARILKKLVKQAN